MFLLLQHKMAADVFKQFYGALVKTLPMDDVEFRVELFSRNLLPGDSYAKVQSSSMTQAEKAEYFLSNVIYPELGAEVSTKKFEDLLEVMSMSGQEALAEKVKGSLCMYTLCSRFLVYMSTVLSYIHMYVSYASYGYIHMYVCIYIMHILHVLYTYVHIIHMYICVKCMYTYLQVNFKKIHQLFHFILLQRSA